MPIPNVVIFGETGSGKSSLINLIAGYHCAEVSSDARGCTLPTQNYHIMISGSPYDIHDTPGFGEGNAGRIPNADAVLQLHQTITDLSRSMDPWTGMNRVAGMNLLIFCVRGSRIKDSMSKYWRQVYEGLCGKQVPIVLVVTGLEGEAVMDHWWHRNVGTFQAYGMHPSAVACITTTKGKQLRSGAYALQEEYDESQAKVRKLVQDTCLGYPWIKRPADFWVRDP